MKPPRPPRKPLPGGKAARNERRKLVATSLNTIGLAVAAIGVIQPVYNEALTIGMVIKVALSGVIAYAAHRIAQVLLRELED